MKKNLYIALISSSLIFNTSQANSVKIHGLDELKDTHHKINYRHSTEIKPVSDSELFPGKGHRLGGDPYVNRTLDIDHEEGKKIAKLKRKSMEIEKENKRKSAELEKEKIKEQKRSSLDLEKARKKSHRLHENTNAYSNIILAEVDQ